MGSENLSRISTKKTTFRDIFESRQKIKRLITLEEKVRVTGALSYEIMQVRRQWNNISRA